MPCRILLCDDCTDYRVLQRAVLEPAGARIVGEAADGRECLGVARDVLPDVILLDVNMGPVGGLEVLPELRRQVPDAQVIVMSTAAADELERASLALGALAYIQKPANIFAIPGLVEAALSPPSPADVMTDRPARREPASYPAGAPMARRSLLTPRPATL